MNPAYIDKICGQWKSKMMTWLWHREKTLSEIYCPFQCLMMAWSAIKDKSKMKLSPSLLLVLSLAPICKAWSAQLPIFQPVAGNVERNLEEFWMSAMAWQGQDYLMRWRHQQFPLWHEQECNSLQDHTSISVSSWTWLRICWQISLSKLSGKTAMIEETG